MISNFSQIAKAAEELLAPEPYGPFRVNIERMENRGLLDVPAILDPILAGTLPNAPVSAPSAGVKETV